MLVATAAVLAPRPGSLERVVADLDDGSAAPPRLVVARAEGALARYDAANGTTTLAFDCGHFRCRHALVLDGDARGLAGRPHVLLRAPEGPLTSAPLEPPLADASLPPPGVASAAAPAFRALPFWPLALALPATATVALAAWRSLAGAREAARAAALGAGATALAVFGLRTMQGDAVVFLYGLAGVVLVVAAVGAALQRRSPAMRAFLGFALALAGALWWLRAWFPSAPSL